MGQGQGLNYWESLEFSNGNMFADKETTAGRLEMPNCRIVIH